MLPSPPHGTGELPSHLSQAPHPCPLSLQPWHQLERGEGQPESKRLGPLQASPIPGVRTPPHWDHAPSFELPGAEGASTQCPVLKQRISRPGRAEPPRGPGLDLPPWPSSRPDAMDADKNRRKTTGKCVLGTCRHHPHRELQHTPAPGEHGDSLCLHF